MSYKKVERDYTFAISQEDLKDNAEVIAPLSDKQEKFLNCTSDIVCWSGGQYSGKSYLCLVDLLIGAVDDKHFTGTVIRTSQKKIKQSGGLFDTSHKMFPPFGASSNQIEMTFSFKSGAKVKFNHLNHNIASYQGSNNTTILIDEAAEEGVSEEDVAYLVTRLRGQSKQKKSLKLTGNPNRDSFLAGWLEKGNYLDEDGFHREDMDGVESLMVLVQGSFEFFKSKQEIVSKYGKEMAKQALTFTSFNANIFANPYAIKYDQFNLHSMMNLREHEKQRLLYGCWKTAVHQDNYLKKDMFNIIPKTKIPLGLPLVRAWDTASSKVGDNGELHPDYTVGILAAYDKEDGSFYIMDMIRFQGSSSEVITTIEKTAQEDPKGTYCILPQDPGSAGKMLCDYLKARLMKGGSKVIIEKTSKSKLARAEPFIISAQEGKISIAQHLFKDEHWNEIEAFTGERSTRHYKDDIVDAISSAYAALAQGNLIPTIRIGDSKKDRARLMRIGGKTLL